MKYPLRAACIQFDFHPFCWGLQWVNRTRQLAEFAKVQGDAMWWIRFGCITVSYRRML